MELEYFVTEIARGDSKISGTAIYAKKTLNEAIALWHQKMASARMSELFTSELCYITDSMGNFFNEYVDHYVKEPVETPTE